MTRFESAASSKQSSDGRIMREQLEALWTAANNHALLMFGEFVVEGYQGEENPPAPSDEEIIRLVTEYLASTI